MSIYIKGKKNVFATEKRVRKITTLIYYKATVIEIVWYWHKKKKNGIRQKTQKQIHTPMITPSMIKEARIYNGEKTVCSYSGAGKTGQLHVREWN